jgi:hypothetical protein
VIQSYTFMVEQLSNEYCKEEAYSYT